MALKKEKGIVIQSLDYGDSDRMISLAGESEIRMKFISKGIRKSKRRAIASTELGSLIEIDFYDQNEKDWKSIKEVNLINRFDELKSSYSGSLLVFYFCEMIATCIQRGKATHFSTRSSWGHLNSLIKMNLLWNYFLFSKSAPLPI